MIYQERMGVTMEDIERVMAQRSLQYRDLPFEWDIKYLPVLIGVIGIGGFFIYKRIKKKRKKGK